MDASDLLLSEKLSGERCMEDKECLMGYCKNRRCAGLAAGESCTNTNQCTAGYFCSGNVCTATQAQGAACTADDDCAIDMICAVSLSE